MAVIQFSEVAKWTNTDTEGEKRIQEKEAIYRGLLEKEADYSGRTLEETLPKQQARDEWLAGKHMDGFKEIASLKGISVNEVLLDVRIESMEMLLEVMADPPSNFVNELI